MNKFRNITAVLSAAILMMTAAVSCGSSSSSSSSSQATTAAASSTEADTEASTEPTEERTTVKPTEDPTIGNNSDFTEQLAKLLDKSIWVGSDGEEEAEAIQFDGTKATILLQHKSKTQKINSEWTCDENYMIFTTDGESEKYLYDVNEKTEMFILQSEDGSSTGYMQFTGKPENVKKLLKRIAEGESVDDAIEFFDAEEETSEASSENEDGEDTTGEDGEETSAEDEESSSEEASEGAETKVTDDEE